MKRGREDSDTHVVFDINHGAMAKSMKALLDDKLFIDAKIASRSSPENIILGHRNILAASSRFFLRKFRNNPDPDSIIFIERVSAQNLR